jgi:hypothetical protein
LNLIDGQKKAQQLVIDDKSAVPSLVSTLIETRKTPLIF